MEAEPTSLDRLHRSHRSLAGSLEMLTDDQARSPSRLPGWTIGHLLTHLARNADSTTRRWRGAMFDEIVEQYPGGLHGRADEIEAGSGRSATALRADVVESSDRLEETALAMTEAAWDATTIDVTGTKRPARALLVRRWREVEIHRVDLGMGYEPSDWPSDFVDVVLGEELPRLATRAPRVELLTWLLDRGPLPDVQEW